MKNYSILLVLLLTFSACSDYLDPTRTNNMSYEDLQTIPEEKSISFRGLMTNTYRSFPTSYDVVGDDFLDCATDNAISNITSSSTSKMQTQAGYWTSINSPIGGWTARYDDLRNLNQFIADGINSDMVFVTSNESLDSIYKARLKGEAYFLRAWVQFDLLRRYAGIDTDGQLLGYPIVTEMLDVSQTDLARAPYDTCVNQILADIDTAYNAGLQVVYAGPNKYTGADNIGRPTKVACLALKSRLLLYAASPAFAPNGTLDINRYRRAAEASKAAIDLIGWDKLPQIYSVENISSEYYNAAQNDELILRKVANKSNNLEKKNYIPTKYGSGRTNPTQNLVDAFPMANGYPITDLVNSGYAMDSMYEGRDPRFYMTILYNGAIYDGDTVATYVGGKDYLNGSSFAKINTSTRTGYYLRKWMDSDITIVPKLEKTNFHYAAIFRQVELYLNFAEAAYYAGDIAIDGKSVKDALEVIRDRAGITSNDYVNSVSGDALEDLIKNERRIELCFEGHRFFDLRRWKDDLNTPISIIEITQPTDNTFAYETKVAFTPELPNSYYCPLPINEVMKAKNITQNTGW